jgi:predicted PurR-regulated permease PerM
MLHETGVRLPRVIHLATPARSATPDPRRTAIVALTLLLLLGAAMMMWPFVAPLVLAAWFANLSRPLFIRFRRALHGRERAAGLLTALLVVAACTPLAIAVLTLIPAAESLLQQLRTASGGKGVLAALVSGGGGAPTDGKGLVGLAKEYGAGASKVLAVLASTSIDVVLGAFVFFAVFYAILVEGDRWWAWARAHSPGDPVVFDRLAGAFHEAGRGLIVGSGLTALVQGGLATLIYVVFGVPRALLLGMLTVIGALIPMTGPMIVWVPVAAGLALTGHFGKAIGLAGLCAAVVGTIDNIIRPWLSRRFHVGMPATIVLVAILGGVVVLGGWGLFLGPLVVRLAGEMLQVCRERRLFGRPVPERHSNKP